MMNRFGWMAEYREAWKLKSSVGEYLLDAVQSLVRVLAGRPTLDISRGFGWCSGARAENDGHGGEDHPPHIFPIERYRMFLSPWPWGGDPVVVHSARESMLILLNAGLLGGEAKEQAEDLLRREVEAMVNDLGMGEQRERDRERETD